MLAGKILGVGAVGLTADRGYGVLAAFVLGSTNLAAGVLGSGHIPISLTQIVFFVAYFLFGFLLYSSIAAALGAMTNSEQELQQLNMFLGDAAGVLHVDAVCDWSGTEFNVVDDRLIDSVL